MAPAAAADDHVDVRGVGHRALEDDGAAGACRIWMLAVGTVWASTRRRNWCSSSTRTVKVS